MLAEKMLYAFIKQSHLNMIFKWTRVLTLTHGKSSRHHIVPSQDWPKNLQQPTALIYDEKPLPCLLNNLGLTTEQKQGVPTVIKCHFAQSGTTYTAVLSSLAKASKKFLCPYMSFQRSVACIQSSVSRKTYRTKSLKALWKGILLKSSQI